MAELSVARLTHERQWQHLQVFQVSVLVFFALGFGADMFAIFLDRINTTAFVTIAFITGGGIILLMPGLQSLTLGVTGITAKFDQLGQILASQQEILHDLVIYSVAEIIYRDLLWPIGHNYKILCDCSEDQQHWLTFLFDHGLLQGRDMSQWVPFNKIEKGRNLSDIFKATPAAEYLMKLRGEPTPT